VYIPSAKFLKLSMSPPLLIKKLKEIIILSSILIKWLKEIMLLSSILIKWPVEIMFLCFILINLSMFSYPLSSSTGEVYEHVPPLHPNQVSQVTIYV
jgi:hypothetical protein